MPPAETCARCPRAVLPPDPWLGRSRWCEACVDCPECKADLRRGHDRQCALVERPVAA